MFYKDIEYKVFPVLNFLEIYTDWLAYLLHKHDSLIALDLSQKAEKR